MQIFWHECNATPSALLISIAIGWATTMFFYIHLLHYFIITFLHNMPSLFADVKVLSNPFISSTVYTGGPCRDYTSSIAIPSFLSWPLAPEYKRGQNEVKLCHYAGPLIATTALHSLHIYKRMQPYRSGDKVHPQSYYCTLCSAAAAHY